MSRDKMVPNEERPLRDRVHDVIRTRIFEGVYRPGTVLVERTLAEEFGVSRSPIRESLRMLRQEGLVNDSSRGAVVTGLSPKEVDDLFDVRLALEVLACRLAADRATPSILGQLSELVDRAQAGHDRGAVREVQEANTDFHDAIADIAGNGFLQSALEPLQGRMRWLSRQLGGFQELIEEHRHLYEAIASRDPEQAGLASAAHIQKYRNYYYEHLKAEAKQDN